MIRIFLESEKIGKNIYAEKDKDSYILFFSHSEACPASLPCWLARILPLKTKYYNALFFYVILIKKVSVATPDPLKTLFAVHLDLFQLTESVLDEIKIIQFDKSPSVFNRWFHFLAVCLVDTPALILLQPLLRRPRTSCWTRYDYSTSLPRLRYSSSNSASQVPLLLE